MTASAAIDNPHTRGIARFVAGLHYESIPPAVLHRLKLLLDQPGGWWEG